MISRIGFDKPVGCTGFCLLPELLIPFPTLLLCWKFKGSLEGRRNPSEFFPSFRGQVTVLLLFAKKIAFLLSSSTQQSVNEHWGQISVSVGIQKQKGEGHAASWQQIGTNPRTLLWPLEKPAFQHTVRTISTREGNIWREGTSHLKPQDCSFAFVSASKQTQMCFCEQTEAQITLTCKGWNRPAPIWHREKEGEKNEEDRA